MVLAWDAVLAGGRGLAPGNVVLHELAHKLDMATGQINGTPPLASRAARARWAEVCTRVYDLHRTRVTAGWPTAMDAYGATNEAEFFAVATETYFLRPRALAWEHPDLYQVLADFYRLELPSTLAPDGSQAAELCGVYGIPSGHEYKTEPMLELVSV